MPRLFSLSLFSLILIALVTLSAVGCGKPKPAPMTSEEVDDIPLNVETGETSSKPATP